MAANEKVEEKETAEKAVRAPAKKTRRKKQIMERGKRKEAIARASIKAGKGIVRVNGILATQFPNPFARQIMLEPLAFLDEPFDFDISVSVKGGGVMGQAQAVRIAMARALVAFKKSDVLRKAFLDFDRSMIVEDTRRVEPKKFKGPKARARFTKSYR
ncbi:TPA: 30S ribosomal protein S9 [Candidatus Micrarchaeota archaeon]|nr:30S ribosomal protein S9 [Candidatus Micrarchaeota archaeon]